MMMKSSLQCSPGSAMLLHCIVSGRTATRHAAAQGSGRVWSGRPDRCPACRRCITVVRNTHLRFARSSSSRVQSTSRVRASSSSLRGVGGSVLTDFASKKPMAGNFVPCGGPKSGEERGGGGDDVLCWTQDFRGDVEYGRVRPGSRYISLNAICCRGAGYRGLEDLPSQCRMCVCVCV